MKIIEITHTESVKPVLNFNSYNIEVSMKASIDGDEDIDEAKKRLINEARTYIDAVVEQALPVFTQMCSEVEKSKKKF
jgi:hypothetical protein